MGAIDLFFITINHNVSFIGKIWCIVMLLLRLLVLLLAGFTLFSDEQERFICNTIQPGCSNVCFDTFAPVSVVRLWFLHLILLCLAHLMFATYVMHKVLSFCSSEGFCCEVNRRSSSFTIENSSREVSLHKAPLHDLPHESGVPRFYISYLLVVILRILLEAIFSTGQFYLVSLTIPRSFLCYEAPCTSGVECYTSRPSEKTLMLNFMLVTASLSILLSLADLVRSVKVMVKSRRKSEMLMEELSKGEQSSMFTTTTVTEENDVVLTKRVSPSGSSKMNDVRDEISAAGPESNSELPSTKMNGGPVPKTWKSERNKDRKIEGSGLFIPLSTQVPSQLKPPVSPKTTTPIGVKKLCPDSPFSFHLNSGQPSDCSVLQDKRAWV
ncbi:gap junction delta-4 protein-like [Melanotaenia boesemani]|uniref:gap junction delta-4 protein-like n=1 Tax=Melanotaenia boesemani TaxID=1250792 RepID=UPI001C03D0BF|nr:gap junction delta-4 protein-like [Melanotaenia boesemani]